MSRTLADFVRESNRIEGITREPWRSEVEATRAFLQNTLTVEALNDLVQVYAPGHVLREHTGLDVRVGSYIAPRGGPDIRTRLVELIDQITTNQLSSLSAHIAYEKLHPFTDGNGRSGRALWLWMRNGDPGLGFLHEFYYETLRATPLPILTRTDG